LLLEGVGRVNNDLVEEEEKLCEDLALLLEDLEKTGEELQLVDCDPTAAFDEGG